MLTHLAVFTWPVLGPASPTLPVLMPEVGTLGACVYPVNGGPPSWTGTDRILQPCGAAEGERRHAYCSISILTVMMAASGGGQQTHWPCTFELARKMKFRKPPLALSHAEGLGA